MLAARTAAIADRWKALRARDAHPLSVEPPAKKQPTHEHTVTFYEFYKAIAGDTLHAMAIAEADE